MRSPCQYCEKRTVTCHGFCKDYQDWKKEQDEKAAQRAADRRDKPNFSKRMMNYIWREMRWK